jgi:type VI secretion system secreted protein VgrG
MVGFGDLRAAEAGTRLAFDRERFAQHLRENALPAFGTRRCAAFVREALEAGGLSAASRPRRAKDYGPWLLSRGFRPVDKVSYKARVGDVVVFEPVTTDGDGHIQGWDGQHWISDFVQPSFWPSSRYKGASVAFAVYRR